MKMVKRLASMLLVVALLSACFCVSALAFETKTLYTTGSCYIREAPNKNADSIGGIPKGKTVKADNCEYDDRGVRWYYCSYNGVAGWVSEKNLSTKKPSGGGSSSKATHKNYVVITGSCNLRKSPSLDGKKVGLADKGDSFKCTDAAVDDRGVVWYKISYKGGSAWVSSKYSKTTNSGSSSDSKPSATPKPIDYSKFVAAEYYVQVTASSLNLRFDPSSESSIIASYRNGDVLYAMRTNGDWIQVLDEETNRSGYMAAKYLVKYEVEQAVEADPETAVTTGSTVSSIEELQSAAPYAVLFDAPEGATNVVYSWQNIGSKIIAEVAFTSEGINYVLRAAACDTAADMINIDNSEIDPEQETGDLHVVISQDGNTAIAHFYIDANSTQYSLSGPAANDGALVKAMAEHFIGSDNANIPDLVFVS